MRIKNLTVERYKLETWSELDIPAGHEAYIHALVGLCSWGPYSTGKRKSVFHPPVQGIYLDACASTRKELFGSGEGCDVVVAMCPATANTLTRYPVIRQHTIGFGNHAREVWEILGADGPSQRLRVGETLNQKGGWSSWPPHSFDHDSSLAPEFEEVFVAFTRPKDGYGLMRLKGTYSGGLEADGVRVVRTGDMFEVPLGEHPIVGAPGTEIMYFWVYLSPVDKQYGRWAEDVGSYA